MGTIREALGFNLKLIRGKRTQEAMAEHLGIPKRTYVRFELGEAFPQGATLRQILKTLKVDETDLVQLPTLRTHVRNMGDSDLLGQIVRALTALDESQLPEVLSRVEELRAESRARRTGKFTDDPVDETDVSTKPSKKVP